MGLVTFKQRVTKDSTFAIWFAAFLSAIFSLLLGWIFTYPKPSTWLYETLGSLGHGFGGDLIWAGIKIIGFFVVSGLLFQFLMCIHDFIYKKEPNSEHLKNS